MSLSLVGFYGMRGSMGYYKPTTSKKDDNHNEISKFYTDRHCSVLDTHELKNCFDILVAKDGVTVAIEIKDGEKPPSKRKLTEGEFKFSISWRGKYCVVENLDDAERVYQEFFCAKR